MNDEPPQYYCSGGPQVCPDEASPTNVSFMTDIADGLLINYVLTARYCSVFAPYFHSHEPLIMHLLLYAVSPHRYAASEASPTLRPTPRLLQPSPPAALCFPSPHSTYTYPHYLQPLGSAWRICAIYHHISMPHPTSPVCGCRSFHSSSSCRYHLPTYFPFPFSTFLSSCLAPLVIYLYRDITVHLIKHRYNISILQ